MKSFHAQTGTFGDFGGMFVPELLVKPLQEVAVAFEKFKKDKKAQAQLQLLLHDFAGRPTPLYCAENFSKKYGHKIYFKREDMLHGGAHKTNNTLGQGLLAKIMKKRELIAETGAGQHGVAVAMIGALLGIPVKIFMGSRDVERQHMNVMRMKLFGAQVVSVTVGSQTLKDAINEALRYYVAHSDNSYYVFGTAAGPHPFPSIVRYFQQVIGKESRSQIIKREGKLPDAVFACVGGGSNAIGIFSAFLRDKKVKLFGAEAAGGASLNNGTPGILHGSYSYVLQDTYGNISESQSISAGLDYPGVGPEHSALKDAARAVYLPITDQQALDALQETCTLEGILPALESSHAIAAALQTAKKMKKNSLILINISGRGDKDLTTITSHLTI